jgi:hypothetical protein
MRAELLQLAADLSRRREPFVLAMVVRREPYSSAQAGDMAISPPTAANPRCREKFLADPVRFLAA